MKWLTLLGLSVLGAFVTTIGSLTALFLKEFVAATSLERWKTRQTLIGAYRRYQMPIFLAAEELSNRLYGLSRDNSDRDEREIGLAVLRSPVVREPSAAANDHYIRYRFVSNVYRLCTFLGGVKLYRRDIGMLNVEELDRNRRLDACLRNIQSVLADGWINQHDDLAGLARLPRLSGRTACNRPRHGRSRRAPLHSRFRQLHYGAQRRSRGDGTGALVRSVRSVLRMPKARQGLPAHPDADVVVYLTDLMELPQPKRIDRSHITTGRQYRLSFDAITGGTNWVQTPLPAGAQPVHQ